MKCTEIGVCCSKIPYALHWNNRGKIYMYSLCCSTSDINPAQISIVNIPTSFKLTSISNDNTVSFKSLH